MPPNPDPVLLDIFWRVGPLITVGVQRVAGVGVEDVPLTAQELAAWATGCGVTLTPWEFETLLVMSQHYFKTKLSAFDPQFPAPWKAERTEENQKALAKSIKSFLRA